MPSGKNAGKQIILTGIHCRGRDDILNLDLRSRSNYVVVDRHIMAYAGGY